jgi:hypothetical protein
MIKLDDDFLTELGYQHLPVGHRRVLLAAIYEELELRVGMRLTNSMSPAQLTEFERFIDRNDEQAALTWLQKHFPSYRDVVREEFATVRLELRMVKGDIESISTLYRDVELTPSLRPSPWAAEPSTNQADAPAEAG